MYPPLGEAQGSGGGPELEVQTTPGWKAFGREQAQRPAGPFTMAMLWRSVQQCGPGTPSPGPFGCSVEPRSEVESGCKTSPCAKARLRHTELLLYFRLALMCPGVVFCLCRFTEERGPRLCLGFLRLAEAVITWISLQWPLSPASLPPTKVHPCLSIPPLEIAELFKRSHRYLN